MPLFAPTTRFPDRFCRLSLTTTTTTPCVTRLLSTRLSVRRYATRRKNSGERWASSHGVFHRLFSYSPILKGLLIDKLMGLVILVAEFNVPRATHVTTHVNGQRDQPTPLPPIRRRYNDTNVREKFSCENQWLRLRENSRESWENYFDRNRCVNKKRATINNRCKFR